MNQRMADFSPVFDGDASHAPAGLFTAVVTADRAPLALQTILAPLAPAEVSRVRGTALRLLQRYGPTVTVEITCVQSQMATDCLRPLESSGEISVKLRMLEPTKQGGVGMGPATASTDLRDGRTSINMEGKDPFGMRPELRSKLATLGRFLFARQPLVTVRGRDFLPQRGSAIVLCTTQAPLCWSAIVLAAAFDAAGRPLRVFYDREMAAVPGIGALLNSLGAVPSGLANAKALLERGETVCMLFPKPISLEAGGRSGEATSFGLAPARLSLLMDRPIIPTIIRQAKASAGLSSLLAEACGMLKDPKPAEALRRLGSRLSLLLSPCRLEISFSPPVRAPRSPGKDTDEVAAEIAQRLQALMD